MQKNKSNPNLANGETSTLVQNKTEHLIQKPAFQPHPDKDNFFTKPIPYPKNGLYGLL